MRIAKRGKEGHSKPTIQVGKSAIGRTEILCASIQAFIGHFLKDEPEAVESFSRFLVMIRYEQNRDALLDCALETAYLRTAEHREAMKAFAAWLQRDPKPGEKFEELLGSVFAKYKNQQSKKQ